MDKWDIYEVPDTGRRGEPRRGCDCVQCWGQCIIDHGSAARDAFQEDADPLFTFEGGDD